MMVLLGGDVLALSAVVVAAVSATAAAIGVAVGILKFKSELNLTRAQRMSELRWKRAEAAKQINDEMLEDHEAWAACQMLDYDGQRFDIPRTDEKGKRITHRDVRAALDPLLETDDHTVTFIRQSFDSLFYYMAIMEHYIDKTLILRDDVMFPIEYYVRILLKFKICVDDYLEHYKLSRTQAFLRRYDMWRVGD